MWVFCLHLNTGKWCGTVSCIHATAALTFWWSTVTDVEIFHISQTFSQLFFLCMSRMPNVPPYIFRNDTNESSVATSVIHLMLKSYPKCKNTLQYYVQFKLSENLNTKSNLCNTRLRSDLVSLGSEFLCDSCCSLLILANINSQAADQFLHLQQVLFSLLTTWTLALQTTLSICNATTIWYDTKSGGHA